MILGITGAFGCGKSTVRQLFATAGWHVFDADECCHQLYASGNPTLMDGLRRRWGEQVFTADGLPDRAMLGRIVFADGGELAALTELIYPLMNECLERDLTRCREQRRDGAFELPLLYEGDYAKRFDAVLTVWADPELRRRRLLGRGFDREAVARRENAQMNPDRKLELADFALINNGSPQELNRQFEEFLFNI